LDVPLVSDKVFLSFIVLYYGYTTVAVIHHIFTKSKVDADTIISAVSAYLMIGLSFAVAFMLVHFGSQGGLSEATADRIIEWPDIFYFSMVTLTTLGYGDISPTVPIARSLATLEAVCGVMYMSILIARLVSEYQMTRRGDN
jgi:voltage-gated potassium channel Kch